mgnify:CR=1 FL=1
MRLEIKRWQRPDPPGRPDHLRRLGHRAGQGARIAVAAYDPLLRREARLLGANLRRVAAAEADALGPDGDGPLHRAHARLDRAAHRLERRETGLRRRVLTSGQASPRLFATTDALRWLRRSTAHAERVLHHLAAAEGQGADLEGRARALVAGRYGTTPPAADRERPGAVVRRAGPGRPGVVIRGIRAPFPPP